MESNEVKIAAILAGGRSSRMGRDKAMIEVGGMTMLERVVRVAREVCPRVVVLGRERGAGLLGDVLVEFLPDEDEARAGPMPALIGVLELVRAPVLLLACDMPLVTAELLRFLIGAHMASGSVVATLATSRSAAGVVRAEPALAIYTPGAVRALRELVARERGSFQGLLKDSRVRAWEVPEDRVGELLNVNDGETLAEAERWISAQEKPRPEGRG